MSTAPNAPLHLLIVDDEATNLAVLVAIASKLPGCSVEGLRDPLTALARAKAAPFDLVIVDYRMPGMDGVAFISTLSTEPGYETVPFVMVTADHDRAVRLAAISAGATDFLTKPIDAIEFRARASNLLKLRRAQLQLAERADWLAQEVHKATSAIAAREEEVIWRLAKAIEFRDGGTGEHISRVARVAQLIAEQLGLDATAQRTIYLAAPLHDVGKIGVADAILSKPGRLSPDETSAMREHVRIGETILAGGSSDLIHVAEAIAATHHEKWDGSGYPRGLKSTSIPLEGRIAAVADVFDALCSARPYKAAWPPDRARAEILAGSGSHFDPACVAAFEQNWPKICAVLNQGTTTTGEPVRTESAA